MLGRRGSPPEARSVSENRSRRHLGVLWGGVRKGGEAPAGPSSLTFDHIAKAFLRHALGDGVSCLPRSGLMCYGGTEIAYAQASRRDSRVRGAVSIRRGGPPAQQVARPQAPTSGAGPE